MATRSAIADQIKADALKQKQDEIARNLWINSSPDVARSYANDPRTQIANNSLSAGTDMSPLTGGLTEGIARLGQGVLGGIVSKQQRGKYGAAEGNLENKVGSSLTGANAATQAGVGGGDANAAAAVAGAAGGGNIPVPGATPPPPPSPPLPIANVASALTGPPPGAAPPVDPSVAGAAPPVAPPNFTQAPAMGRGVGVRPTAPTTAGITPTTTPGSLPPRSPGGGGVTSSLRDQLLYSPAVPRRSAVASGIPRSKRNDIPVREAALQASATGGFFSGGDTAPVSGTPDAEARGWLAPRSARNAAQLAGKFGDRDDPYGSYGAVYGNGTYGRPSKPLPDMTVGQVLDFGDNVLRPATKAAGIGRAADGSVVGTSAGGAFQIEGSTLRRLAPKVLGADYRTADYGVVNQDKLGKALFDESKQGNLKAIWTSLPDARPGAYANKSWEEMKPLIIAGESSVKGGTSASAGSGGGGVDAYGVPIAPQMDVAPLPPAPVQPPRPAPRDPITSARLETIQRLLPNVQGLGPGQMGAAVHMADDWYGKGLDQVQEGRMQQDRQEAALTQAGYETNLGIYGQGNKDLFQQRVGQTTADQAAIRANQATQYVGQIAAAEKAKEEQFLADESKKERDAKMEQAKIKAAAFKPPQFASKEYYQNVDKVSTGGSVLDAVNARPQSLGLQNYLNQALTQRTDPEGVAARAAVAKYAGLILHGVSGSAVTPSEYSRNITWLPSPTDTPGTIRTKMARIMNDAQAAIENLRGMYGTDNGFGYQPSGFAAVAAAGAQSPNWGKAEKVSD